MIIHSCRESFGVSIVTTGLENSKEHLHLARRPLAPHFPVPEDPAGTNTA
jgi:hypothetical protein